MYRFITFCVIFTSLVSKVLYYSKILLPRFFVFWVRDSKNKKSGQQWSFQKVWKIALCLIKDIFQEESLILWSSRYSEIDSCAIIIVTLTFLITNRQGLFFHLRIKWKIACRVDFFSFIIWKIVAGWIFFFKNAKQAFSFIRQVRVWLRHHS